jgi:hypothetical protein
MNIPNRASVHHAKSGPAAIRRFFSAVYFAFAAIVHSSFKIPRNPIEI